MSAQANPPTSTGLSASLPPHGGNLKQALREAQRDFASERKALPGYFGEDGDREIAKEEKALADTALAISMFVATISELGKQFGAQDPQYLRDIITDYVGDHFLVEGAAGVVRARLALMAGE